MKPRAISLCCGAGIGCIGFSRYFETVHAVDNWNIACQSHLNNHPHANVQYGSIADRKLINKAVRTHKHIDIIYSSTPCPSFSKANSAKKALDIRSELYLDAIDWVKAFNPQVYIAENVNTIKSSPILGLAIAKLRKLGYNTATWILDAADYGTPQHRARLFLVASLKSLPEIPTSTHGRGKHPYISIGQSIGQLSDELALLMGCSRLSAQYSWIMDEVPSGGNWRSLTGERLKSALMDNGRNPDRKVNNEVYSRLNGKRPCPTLNATGPIRQRRIQVHPKITRPLSVLEFLRLQGVSTPFVLCGSQSDRYRQAGNGIPVQLAEAVAEAARKCM